MRATSYIMKWIAVACLVILLTFTTIPSSPDFVQGEETNLKQHETIHHLDAGPPLSPLTKAMKVLLHHVPARRSVEAAHGNIHSPTLTSKDDVQYGNIEHKTSDNVLDHTEGELSTTLDSGNKSARKCKREGLRNIITPYNSHKGVIGTFARNTGDGSAGEHPQRSEVNSFEEREREKVEGPLRVCKCGPHHRSCRICEGPPMLQHIRTSLNEEKEAMSQIFNPLPELPGQELIERGVKDILHVDLEHEIKAKDLDDLDSCSCNTFGEGCSWKKLSREHSQTKFKKRALATSDVELFKAPLKPEAQKANSRSCSCGKFSEGCSCKKLSREHVPAEMKKGTPERSGIQPCSCGIFGEGCSCKRLSREHVQSNEKQGAPTGTKGGDLKVFKSAPPNIRPRSCTCNIFSEGCSCTRRPRDPEDITDENIHQTSDSRDTSTFRYEHLPPPKPDTVTPPKRDTTTQTYSAKRWLHLRNFRTRKPFETPRAILDVSKIKSSLRGDEFHTSKHMIKGNAQPKEETTKRDLSLSEHASLKLSSTIPRSRDQPCRKLWRVNTGCLPEHRLHSTTPVPRTAAVRDHPLRRRNDTLLDSISETGCQKKVGKEKEDCEKSRRTGFWIVCSVLIVVAICGLLYGLLFLHTRRLRMRPLLIAGKSAISTPRTSASELPCSQFRRPPACVMRRINDDENLETRSVHHCTTLDGTNDGWTRWIQKQKRGGKVSHAAQSFLPFFEQFSIDLQPQ